MDFIQFKLSSSIFILLTYCILSSTAATDTWSYDDTTGNVKFLIFLVKELECNFIQIFQILDHPIGQEFVKRESHNHQSTLTRAQSLRNVFLVILSYFVDTIELRNRASSITMDIQLSFLSRNSKRLKTCHR